MMSTSEVVFICASTVSALMSFSVLVTGMVFANMRKRQFMQIILCISLCDTIACAASAFGFPPQQSPLCPMQSFFAAAGFKSSWMWIGMLCHQMYNYVSYGGFGLRRHHMHLIVWSLSIGTTLIPLVQTTYGRDDDSGWCFLTDGSKDSVVTAIWSSVTFNLVLLMTLVIMMYYNFMLYLNYRDVRDLKVITVFRSLYLYPLGMIVIWLPNLVISALMNWGAIDLSSPAGSVLVDVVFIAATQNGTITAIIFFTMSKEARIRWGKLLNRTSKYLSTQCYRSLCCCLVSTEDRNSSKASEENLSNDDDVLVYYGDACDVDESVYQSRTNSTNSPIFRSNSKAYKSPSDEEDQSITAGLLANAHGNKAATASSGSHHSGASGSTQANTDNNSKHSQHALMATSYRSNNSYDQSPTADTSMNSSFFSAVMNFSNPPKLSSQGTESALYPSNSQGRPSAPWISTNDTGSNQSNSLPSTPNNSNNTTTNGLTRGSSSDNSYRVGASFGSGSNDSLGNSNATFSIHRTQHSQYGQYGQHGNYINAAISTNSANGSLMMGVPSTALMQQQEEGVVRAGASTTINTAQTQPITGLTIHNSSSIVNTSPRGSAYANQLAFHNSGNNNNNINVNHSLQTHYATANAGNTRSNMTVLSVLLEDEGMEAQIQSQMQSQAESQQPQMQQQRGSEDCEVEEEVVVKNY